MLIRERRVPPAGFGPMLRTARERAGLGQREAARDLGLSAGYMAHLEAGERCPSATVADRIADLLGLDQAEREQLLAAAVDDAGRDHPERRTAATR